MRAAPVFRGLVDGIAHSDELVEGATMKDERSALAADRQLENLAEREPVVTRVDPLVDLAVDPGGYAFQ